MDAATEAELYDRAVQYMPYLRSIGTVLDYVEEHAPRGAHVLDVMCGTGYFLGELHKRRSDLICHGTDIDADRIGYANARYPEITFEEKDILEMDHEVPVEVVTCLGALHHIEYEDQGTAVYNLASMVKPGGFAVISDCYIGNYENESERQRAARRLGLQYLRYGIEHGAPEDVQEELRKIMHDDIAKKEFKTSRKRREPELNHHFTQVETVRIWPSRARGFGDHIHYCR